MEEWWLSFSSSVFGVNCINNCYFFASIDMYNFFLAWVEALNMSFISMSCVFTYGHKNLVASLETLSDDSIMSVSSTAMSIFELWRAV